MLGRWFFLAVVGIGLAVIVRAPHSGVEATITQSCDATIPGTASATFAWKSVPQGAQETWLDVSLAPGFLPAVTTANGPLAPEQLTFPIPALPLGVKVYYRVNTLATGGWKTIASGNFTTRCPAPPADSSPGAVAGSARLRLRYDTGAS